jgi:hypothetical protein
MKIKLFRKEFFFDFLVAFLLIVTLIPLNLTNPEEDFSPAVNEYQDIYSDYSLYSTARTQSRTGDYNDQYFSRNFVLECYQQVSFDSVVLFYHQFFFSKLLSYRLISLPPPA